MKRLLMGAVTLALATPFGALTADNADVDELRRLIEEMKAEHEEKIRELEQRLQAAEQTAQQTTDETDADRRTGTATARPNAEAPGTITSGIAFNPQISVILDGNFYHDDIDGQGTELLRMADGISHAHGGHDHNGHDHGAAEQGFNLREVEIAFSATVDPYFDATAYLAVDGDGNVGLEEAWFQTRSLPYGLKVKGGKFFSDIGYINNQHPHQWDFTDQNLAYINLFGEDVLVDTGVQLTWLPAWGHYTLFGTEILQGNQERFGARAEADETLQDELVEVGLSADALNLDDQSDGPNLYTAFAKYSPDLGFNHALQLGLWGAYADQHQEIHGDPEDGNLHTLQGDAWMWGLDSVYKYDAGRRYGAGSFKLQAEYLWQLKDLNLRFHQARPEQVGAERKFTEDGIYIQGVYGIAPRWQVGLRYDNVGLTTNKLESGGNTLRKWDHSDRWTAALTWIPTEFSRLRLQYARADISIDGDREKFDYVYLQFLMSLGTHGAHKF